MDRFSANTMPYMRMSRSLRREIGFVENQETMKCIVSHFYCARSEFYLSEPTMWGFLSKDPAKDFPYELGEVVGQVALENKYVLQHLSFI